MICVALPILPIPIRSFRRSALRPRQSPSAYKSPFSDFPFSDDNCSSNLRVEATHRERFALAAGAMLSLAASYVASQVIELCQNSRLYVVLESDRIHE